MALGGRILASLFFLVFGGVGLIVTAWLGTQVYRDAQTWKWPAVPCTVLESGITDKGGNSPYAVHVHYQYEWQGRSYSSQQLSTQTKSFSDYGKAQRLADRFRSDTKAVCYVNAAKPTDAVFQRTPLWSAFFIVVPLIFAFVGIGSLYMLWRKTPVSSRAVAAPAKTPQSRKFALLFWLFFLVIGSIVFFFIVVRPLIKTIQARDWQAIPCTIISSRVQSHSSDDGTTYSIDILYSYEIDGREYKANRYTFLGGSSSGRRGKQKIVNQHPPGAKKICYVNPRDRTDAVLNRGLSPVMFFGLIPLVFVAIGFAGIRGTLRKARGGESPVLHKGENVFQAPRPLKVGNHRNDETRLTVELKPKTSPVAKVLGGLFVSVFWNGIVSVFVVQIVGMWRTGEAGFEKWFFTFFLIPFVLVGLFLIYFTIHSFFGLFSPRVRMRASHSPVALGESVELTWHFEGRLDKVRDLKLQLEGREERDTGSGKRRRTETKVFYAADIAHFTNINDLKSGTVLCTIPTGHSPSDTDGAERVIWAIRLKAQVEMGADLNDEYPITVVSPVADEVARG
jgi:uncharacterized protein DUF3592